MDTPSGPVGKVMPLPAPHCRYEISVRSGAGRWVVADVCRGIEDTLEAVLAAMLAGQSVMVEPIEDYAVSATNHHPYVAA